MWVWSYVGVVIYGCGLCGVCHVWDVIIWVCGHMWGVGGVCQPSLCVWVGRPSSVPRQRQRSTRGPSVGRRR